MNNNKLSLSTQFEILLMAVEGYLFEYGDKKNYGWCIKFDNNGLLKLYIKNNHQSAFEALDILISNGVIFCNDSATEYQVSNDIEAIRDYYDLK